MGSLVDTLHTFLQHLWVFFNLYMYTFLIENFNKTRTHFQSFSPPNIYIFQNALMCN